MFVAAILILTVYFNATPIPCVVDTGSMLMLVSAAQTVTIPELSELAEPVRIQTATGEVAGGTGDSAHAAHSTDS